MKRIAIWSGPRNISTALMRAWGNRPDTFVWDEPLYAHYLQSTGKPHPGAAEIIAAGETDWRKVVAKLTESAPPGKTIFYQKHMAHHLLPHIDRAWLLQVENCFLIRDPRDVILSYLVKHEPPQVEDLGFVQQAEIFEYIRATGQGVPPVIDAQDVQNNPRRLLGLLCDRLSIPFTDSMLSWPPGPRESDGVWAKYWYQEVETSTSFRPYQTRSGELPESLAEVHRRCREYYEQLYEHRLR
jgi:Sulfotransferase domain